VEIYLKWSIFVRNNAAPSLGLAFLSVPIIWFNQNKKVKQSRNRPGVAQRVPGGLGSQIS